MSESSKLLPERSEMPESGAEWRKNLAKIILGALRSQFNDHGPILPLQFSSVVKRISTQLEGYLNNTDAPVTVYKKTNRRSRHELVLLRKWCHNGGTPPPSYTQLLKMYGERRQR